ncbi:hypothetical protein CHS0354_042250 [Potamilus streckersoni]|uniref:Poly [ADP-ribose] polymerase n=1 Tax=Potamilus streckersoni TaxID=2493646 RepID=A0AAE0STU0_9BIVA|nr:hypothetical protein CHS0354_042250 [Potamilus streckersoni]
MNADCFPSMEMDQNSNAARSGYLEVPKSVTYRSISMESTGSNYADAKSNLDSDDEEGEEMDYYGDDSDYDHGISDGIMHPQLYEDMERLLLIYGHSALHYRLLEAIDEIDVELYLPVSFLDEITADAWRIKRDEPLVIRLHLSLSEYIEASDPPKVEVFQASKKPRFGVGCQMRKILESFLLENWKIIGKELKKIKWSATSKSQSVPTNLASSLEITNLLVQDKDLAALMELDFSMEIARNALIITRGNLTDATNLLLNNPETCTDLGYDTVCGKPPKPKRQSSHPPLLKQLRKLLFSKRSSSMVASATEPAIAAQYTEDLNLMPLSTFDGRNAKKIPPLTDGFLVHLFRYVRQRILTLNEYCVVCDEPHVFQNGAMLKPAVCSRELCVFAFQTLGVMSEAADDIATGAEVVDLLVAMTKAACKSARKEIIFDPFPTVVDPCNRSELSFHPNSKNYDSVGQVLDKFLEMEKMCSFAPSVLKTTLDEINVLIYPLLQWIISSNRSHIVKLPVDRQLSFMHTTHQFLLLNSPPAKEVAFRAAKEKYGSTFAFHGSSIENWHSIIRKGLIVASGTKHMVNGAAYGNGIYLSPHASTSFGYSRMGYGSHKIKKETEVQKNSRFLKSNNITCIALCEVILSPKLKKNSGIWVCPESDHVCTRFFFVYEDGQIGDSGIDTQQKKYLDEIRRAVSLKA